MKSVYKIWQDEQIDDTGIYEEDYIQNTICIVSSLDLANKIVNEAKKNNLELEINELDIFENSTEVLEYLKEYYDDDYEALKDIEIEEVE
ncbi:hypothetical protein MBCUT_06620 [Methanobrevibacter cuticularis]|uniref:Uncharacterized protein n=1 Tax=Methanobrevibacter cuticularis TaxID=47311 RepID=A0A166EGE4_9EURY|nr:hypothetical protein [Methanobrevibacter cuticularis]KZX16624.1 hypothetical protein MBCUT_06620 [Methanobrevibacter cuticularis]